MENKDKSAFPNEETDKNGNPKYQHLGLTKREYFAAMVIQGKIGNPKEIAEHAVWVADELLKQLEHGNK